MWPRSTKPTLIVIFSDSASFRRGSTARALAIRTPSQNHPRTIHGDGICDQRPGMSTLSFENSTPKKTNREFLVDRPGHRFRQRGFFRHLGLWFPRVLVDAAPPRLDAFHVRRFDRLA